MQNFVSLVVFAFILLAGVIFVTRMLLGKEIFEDVAAHWIFYVSRALLRIPLRIIQNAFKLLQRMLTYCFNRR